MSENVNPKMTSSNYVANSRILQKQKFPQNCPKFLENFEEIILNQNQKRVDEPNNKRREIQQCQYKNINGSLRSSAYKKKIFEVSQMNKSGQKAIFGNSQSFTRQRTFSTQIYDNMQTENSFSQVNQSMNFGNFNQNRMHILSFQDEPAPEIFDTQPQKMDQMKIFSDCLENFKKELISEQSNALDHLRYYVNSNEQKINELQEQQEKKANQKVSQFTLSKLNQLQHMKNDMITKISSQMQHYFHDRLLKIENNQHTLYNLTGEFKQDLITCFNSSIDQFVENKLKIDMDGQIDNFQREINQKITLIENQQADIIQKSEEENQKIQLKIQNDENQIGVVQNQFNELQFGMDQIQSQLESKADFGNLKDEFNSCFGQQIANINEEIRQISEIKQDQTDIGLSLIEKQKQNTNKVNELENNMEEKLQLLISEQNLVVEQQDLKKQQMYENLSKIGDKIKQMNETFLKLQATKQIYDEQIEKQRQLQTQTQLTNAKIENLDCTLMTQKDQEEFDHLITISVEDYKNQGSSLNKHNPYRKSNKLNDTQLIPLNQNDDQQLTSSNINESQKISTQSQHEIEESNSENNLFRYSTANQSIAQNDLQKEQNKPQQQNCMQDIQNLLQKGVQSSYQKPPMKLSKLVFRQKKINEQTKEDQIKAMQLENEQEQLEQVSKYPGQEYMPLKSTVLYKQENTSLYKQENIAQLSPIASQKENRFNIPQQIQANNYIRKSFDNFYVPQQRKQSEENSKQQENQPLYLSQYYKLQMIRKSCDFGNSFSKIESEQQNFNPYSDSRSNNYSSNAFYSYQRTNTCPSNTEQNYQPERRNSHTKMLKKRSRLSEIKKEYIESDQNIQKSQSQTTNFNKINNKQQLKTMQNNILSELYVDTIKYEE